LLTAYTTGNLFVVLTVPTDNCKTLFEKYRLTREKTDAYIDVIIPVSFNFPKMGKLIMLLFILFATWFTGSALAPKDYVPFVFSGLLSFFGGVDVALPFMLDLMRLPSNAYQPYVVTGILNGRFATLLAAMNLILFTLLATASLTGVMTINKRKLLVYALTSLVMTAGVILATRAYLDATAAFVMRIYRRDEFSHLDTIRQIEMLQIGIPRDIGIREADLKLLLPNARIHTIESARDYFGNLCPSLDAIVLSAEAGSAWTLICPQYAVVVPQPDIFRWPLAYPVTGGDDAMADFVSRWIDLKQKQPLAFQKF
jgi:hypothetical protein